MTAPRVLLSIPFALGTPGVATTALWQALSASRAGCRVTVACSSVAPGVEVPDDIRIVQTLAIRSVRIPHRVIGRRTAREVHDRSVSRLVRRHRRDFDVVHVWPGACHRTIDTSRSLGLPALRESPSAHTAEANQQSLIEQEACGVPLAADHAFSHNPKKVSREEREFAQAHAVLAPSDYVERTFLDRGFPASQLIRHRYGFDPVRFTPPPGPDPRDSEEHRFTALFVGRCEPTKGLHIALRAWHLSDACRRGRFVIAGTWVDGYAEFLAAELDHPSIELVPFRSDVSDLMRSADVLVLPSVTEGSALVTYEAQGCGAALLVSESSGAMCEHDREGLIHPTRDVDALREHLRQVSTDREHLDRLRLGALTRRPELTWDEAGRRLAEIYGAVAAGSTAPEITGSGRE